LVHGQSIAATNWDCGRGGRYIAAVESSEQPQLHSRSQSQTPATASSSFNSLSTTLQ